MPLRSNLVVVVEDEEEARVFLSRILELEGFPVIGFANGRDALEYLRASGEARLIILDIRMPEMDGFELRAALLRHKRLAKLPVIVVTALDPAECADIAAVRFFRKPVDVDGLVAAVRQYY
jgi:two-component system, response regulator, stage 0 sporulation protein F